jgi:predicted PurR-regulated permease PerM
MDGITGYLALLQWGAICGILGFVISLICLVVLGTLTSRLSKQRPPVEPPYPAQQPYPPQRPGQW